jgi:hypothetical protein
VTTTGIHSKLYHQVNRAVFTAATAVGLVGLALIVFELAGPRTGAALGFAGIMTAFFAGWNMICEKSCASD